MPEIRPAGPVRSPDLDVPAARIEDMDRRRFLAGAAAVPLGLVLAPGPPRRVWKTPLRRYPKPAGPGSRSSRPTSSLTSSRWSRRRGVSSSRPDACRPEEHREPPCDVGRRRSHGPRSPLPAPCTDASRPPDRRRSPRAALHGVAPRRRRRLRHRLRRAPRRRVEIPTGRIASSVAVPGRRATSPSAPTGTCSDGARLEGRAHRGRRRLGRRPRLERTIAPPFAAHDVVFAPDGEHVWVTSGAGRRLAVYERGGRRPVAVLGALGAPQHIAFAGRRALVASGVDGVVRVHRLEGSSSTRRVCRSARTT